MHLNATKLEVYERACRIINEDNSETSAKVHPDYSGRFMFGDAVPAISVDRGVSGAAVGAAVVAALCALCYEADEYADDEGLLDVYEDFADYVPVRQDQLGLGMIYY